MIQIGDLALKAGIFTPGIRYWKELGTIEAEVADRVEDAFTLFD